MDMFERIHQLCSLLNGRRTPVSRVELMHELGWSRATLTRVIRESRDYMGVPIEFDREYGGYILNKRDGKAFELPGLWFREEEIHALLTAHSLLSAIKPGLFEPYIAPLRQRLETLLKHKRAGNEEILARIRILPMAQRLSEIEEFQKIADALLSRKQLRIQYSSRGKEEISERWISPQRLLYYRDNWYLDAWCHKRRAIRTFSLDRMYVAEKGGPAKEIPATTLDRHFTKTYGIFAGPAKHQAVIRFSNQAAKWVADEQWHPDQQSRVLPDGGWELKVPYGDPTELVRDILKFGPEAEVIAPNSLRESVVEKLSQSLRCYRGMKATNS